MRIKQYTAAFLCAVLLAESAAPISVLAAENGKNRQEAQTEQIREEERIGIRTAQELISFGRSCMNETFSRGKKVVLENDISLMGTEFEPIPIFCGTFDGNGHTISGLEILQSGSNLGLFRYVQEGAVVENLTVSGIAAPKGSRTKVGGIVGTNRGTIRNCTFQGSATALGTLGGIVGINEETGVIEACTNEAELNGNRSIGGIAGENLGIVRLSVNKAKVNTTPYAVEDDTDILDYVSRDPSADRSAVKGGLQTEKVNDVGGIVGVSSGAVQGCRNEGMVGYASVGYNIGGIVGRSRGILVSGDNSGMIAGRKDIGGIAGQLEPQLSVEYEKSAMDQVTDIMDQVLDTKGSIVKKVHGSVDDSVDSMDRMDEILKQIKLLTRDEKDYQRQLRETYESQAGSLLDEIDYVLNGMDVERSTASSQAAKRRAQQDLQMIQSQIRPLATPSTAAPIVGGITDPDLSVKRAYITGLVMQIAGILDLTTTLYDDTSDIAFSMEDELGDTVSKLKEQLKSLKERTKELEDLTREYKNNLLDSLERADDDVTLQLDDLYAELDQLTDDLKNDKNSVREDTDKLDVQLENMHLAIKDGQQRARDEADQILGQKKENMFEDISDTMTDVEDGTIFGCANFGVVSADYQGGGIVGTIGAELADNPDEDVRRDGDYSFNWNRYAKASVRSCRNEGKVQVKNDYAGGIVGAAWIGALRDNQNYGDIEATDGDYAGGIVGSSDSSVYNSYSMCAVSGNDYTGGIAGYGHLLSQNCAMVNIVSPEGERKGSIAGFCSEDGIVRENTYVENGLGAVDSATFQDQAKGIRYDQLLARENIPEEFQTLKVTFLVDEKPFREIVCNYGDAVQRSEIPAVPEREGFYGFWEAASLTDVRHSYKIHAMYLPWINTLGSSADAKPELLAVGNFMPDAKLALEELAETETEKLVLSARGRIVRGFRYAVTDPQNPKAGDTVTLHVRAGKANAAFLVTGNETQEAEIRKDGEYLVFDAPVNGQVILIKTYSAKVMAAIAAAMAVLAAVLWIKWKKRVKKP